MNDRLEFEQILRDTALEYDLELPRDFILELYSQLSAFYTECPEIDDN